MRMSGKIRSQNVYSNILTYIISFLSFITIANGITNEIGLQTAWDSYILVAVLVISLLIGFYALLFENAELQTDILIVVIFFLCSYLMSIICFPQNNKYLFTTWSDLFGNPVYSIFVLSLPAYVFARNLRDYSLFCYTMRKSAYIVVGLSVVVFLFMKDSFATQYMSFSYNMLLHLLFLVFYKPQKNILWHNILVALGLFVFVVGGARGALVSFIICAMAYFLVTKGHTARKLIISLIVAIGAIAFIIMRNEIFTLILPWLTKMNINSRTIKMMISADILNSSGRDEIAEEVMKNINLFGHGMMGDRVVCSGVYAHNIFLELICDFGIVVGFILSLIILVILVKGIMKKIRWNHAWIILVSSTGFFKLMLSGSFLDFEPAFFVLMGFCVNSFMENKTDGEIIEENIRDDKIPTEKCSYRTIS